MMVPMEDIFPQIPEPELDPLLIGYPHNLGVFNLLDVEIRYLNRLARDGEHFLKQFDHSEMTCEFVLDGRG